MEMGCLTWQVQVFTSGEAMGRKGRSEGRKLPPLLSRSCHYEKWQMRGVVLFNSLLPLPSSYMYHTALSSKSSRSTEAQQVLEQAKHGSHKPQPWTNFTGFLNWPTGPQGKEAGYDNEQGGRASHFRVGLQSTYRYSVLGTTSYSPYLRFCSTTSLHSTWVYHSLVVTTDLSSWLEAGRVTGNHWTDLKRIE